MFPNKRFKQKKIRSEPELSTYQHSTHIINLTKQPIPITVKEIQTQPDTKVVLKIIAQL